MQLSTSKIPFILPSSYCDWVILEIFLKTLLYFQDLPLIAVYYIQNIVLLPIKSEESYESIYNKSMVIYTMIIRI